MEEMTNNQLDYFLVRQRFDIADRKRNYLKLLQDPRQEHLSEAILSQKFLPLKIIDRLPELKYSIHVQFRTISSEQKLQELIQISSKIDLQNQNWFIVLKQIDNWAEILENISSAHCREIHLFKITQNQRFTVSILKNLERIHFCRLYQLNLLDCMITSIEMIALLDAPRMINIKIVNCPLIRSLKTFGKSHFPSLMYIFSQFRHLELGEVSNHAENQFPLSRTKVYEHVFYRRKVHKFYTKRMESLKPRNSFKLTEGLKSLELADWRFLVKLQHKNISQKTNQKEDYMGEMFDDCRRLMEQIVRQKNASNHSVERRQIGQMRKLMTPQGSHFSEPIMNALYNKLKQQ